MVVQHNLQAMNTNRQLGLTVNNQSKSTEKLSSGYRINRAADDAAGLAISEKMRSQIKGLDKASTNAQDGISVVQTAEGALNEVHSILQRMNELATQAANDTNTSIDRSQLKLEINQLTSEIDRISSTTQFNTMNLLDGDFTNKNLQVGALSGQKITISIHEMSAKGLGLTVKTSKVSDADIAKASFGNMGTNGVAGAGTGKNVYNLAASKFDATNAGQLDGAKMKDILKVSTFENAGRTMKVVQNAIDLVSTQRANLGAIQNRLEHTIANLDTTSENTSAAESRIRDTDMAKEMVTYSKNNILAQAGQSMLAQANQSTQGVLSLL
jgi:flagellin